MIVEGELWARRETGRETRRETRRETGRETGRDTKVEAKYQGRDDKEQRSRGGDTGLPHMYATYVPLFPLLPTHNAPPRNAHE